MNRERISKAYEKIAEGYAELALAFAESTSGEAGAGASAPSAPAPVQDLQPLPDAAGAHPPAPAATRLPARKPQESAFTKCPAHDRPWTEGKFGPYCTSSSEDPEWSNDKGYCRITPRSAGAWQRQHQRVPA